MAVPLKKITKEGVLYSRRPEIECQIDTLELMDRETLVQYCADPNNSIPLEVLLYFLRLKDQSLNEQYFQSLFLMFISCIEICLKRDSRINKLGKVDIIREEVISEVLSMLAEDRMGEDTSLDYYEVNFNAAFKTLKTGILRRVGPANTRDPLANTQPLTSEEGESIMVSPEVEVAAREFFDTSISEFEEPSFRSWFNSAINKLPSDEMRAVGLRIQGIPIESIDPNEQTISTLLDCTSRTVRNKLARAYEKLRAMKAVENDYEKTS
jgi:hypothetical protein